MGGAGNFYHDALRKFRVRKIVKSKNLKNSEKSVELFDHGFSFLEGLHFAARGPLFYIARVLKARARLKTVTVRVGSSPGPRSRAYFSGRARQFLTYARRSRAAVCSAARDRGTRAVRRARQLRAAYRARTSRPRAAVQPPRAAKGRPSST